MNTQDLGKILDTEISRNGINKQVVEVVAKAGAALFELYRSLDLPENIRVHLIKAYMIPILLYPIIPVYATIKTAQSKLKKIQNKALRFAYNEKHLNTRNTKTLHELENIEPVNYTLHVRAEKSLKNLQMKNMKHSQQF